MNAQARNEFFYRNRQRRYTRPYQSNGLDLFLIPAEGMNKILAAYESAIAGMDYGAYMDAGDGLGYDEIAGMDYGYDAALGSILDTIKSVWSGIKSVGSTVWSGAKFVGTNLYTGAKFVGSNIIKGVTKLPTLAKNAYTWAKTARITAPVRWAVSGGKTVGKWVWSGVKWLFQSNTGQTTAAPAGTKAPASPTSFNITTPGETEQQSSGSGGATQVVNIGTGAPGSVVDTGAYYNYPDAGQQPAQSMVDNGGYVNYPSSGGYSAGGAMIDATTGQAVAPEQAEQAGGVSPLVLVGGGLLIAYLLFS